MSVGVSHGESRVASRRTLVGSHESATGPLALADYDGDGELDLFVGSRAIPMRYPVAASSGLFHNDGGGKFVLDTANAAMLANVGLVSAAVFADINGDGHPDLLLAREWGSIALLLNDGHGRFSLAPPIVGPLQVDEPLERDRGGRPRRRRSARHRRDELGPQHAVQADSARPLCCYHGPFGAAGEEEMLMAREDPRIHAVAPLNSYARVRVALPDLVSRLPSFAAYADASIEKVLGPAADRAERLSASTLDHMVFLNRGDHFEAMPLPAEAQLAPAFYAGIADFNGDGFEDVFLAQNFSPTAVGTPRYDAGAVCCCSATARVD